MATIPLKQENMDSKVIDLIYEKQLEYTKAAKKKFSLDKTVNKMIKDRYSEELNKTK